MGKDFSKGDRNSIVNGFHSGYERPGRGGDIVQKKGTRFRKESLRGFSP